MHPSLNHCVVLGFFRFQEVTLKDPSTDRQQQVSHGPLPRTINQFVS